MYGAVLFPLQQHQEDEDKSADDKGFVYTIDTVWFWSRGTLERDGGQGKGLRETQIPFSSLPSFLR